MLYIKHSPSHAAVGRTLSNLWAGDPLGFTNHRPGMWQATDVFHRHHQVPWRLQHSDSFVMRDAKKAAAIDLQNLVPNLWRREGTKRHGGGGWARWQGWTRLSRAWVQRSDRGNITVVQVYKTVNGSEQNNCMIRLFLKDVTFILDNNEKQLHNE